MGIKQHYKELADRLGYGIDFEKLKTRELDRRRIITEIADRYCDSTDMFEKDSCMAALILFFWGEITKMQNKVRATNLYAFEDCLQHLYICIENACSYRAWADGHINAEQAIRASISARGAAAILYDSNLDKNKANSNSMDLDDTCSGSEDEDGNTWLDRMQAAEDDYTEAELTAIQIVQYFIDKNKLVESVILDNICFNNCERQIKETNTYIDEDGNEIKTNSTYHQFSQLALVKVLNDLPKDYAKTFMMKYSVAEEALQAAITKIQHLNNQKLYKCIESTLNLLRANAGLLGMPVEN